MLGGHGLTAALQDIMAWLRVRAPLVRLTGDEYARLSGQLRDWGLDPARD